MYVVSALRRIFEAFRRTEASFPRTVIPELLDELPPGDPRAVHSRGDLRRVNKLMGNADIMAGALDDRPSSIVHRPSSVADDRRFSIVELGGGDGTFLLELAKRVAPVLGTGRAILVDQQDLMTSHTREALAALGWHVDAVKADVFEWLGRHRPDLVETYQRLYSRGSNLPVEYRRELSAKVKAIGREFGLGPSAGEELSGRDNPVRGVPGDRDASFPTGSLPLRAPSGDSADLTELPLF